MTESKTLQDAIDQLPARRPDPDPDAEKLIEALFKKIENAARAAGVDEPDNA